MTIVIIVGMKYRDCKNLIKRHVFEVRNYARMVAMTDRKGN